MLFNALFTAQVSVVPWFWLNLQLLQCLLFVKLHGAPLSFRIASTGLGLCQTQSVKLVHPQRLQSAWYVQYYVTSAQQEESGGKIKPDTPTIWEVNLELRGLFSAWNAPRPSLILLGEECKCSKPHQRRQIRVVKFMCMQKWCNMHILFTVTPCYI